MLISDGIMEFICECEIRNYSPRTIKGYRNNTLYLMRYLQREHDITEVEEVKLHHLKQFFQHKRAGHKATYLNVLNKSFRAFFKYLTEEQYIQENPILKLSFSKEEKPVIQTFSSKEVRAMIEAHKENSDLAIRLEFLNAMWLSA